MPELSGEGRLILAIVVQACLYTSEGLGKVANEHGADSAILHVLPLFAAIEVVSQRCCEAPKKINLDSSSRG